MSELLLNNKKLIEEWDYEKNNDLDINKLTIGSGKKAHWICSSCGFEWKTQIYLRQKHGCPNCAHKKIGVNNAKIKDSSSSLLEVFPKVVSVWDYKRNFPLRPENFASKSNKKVWWKCSICGHEWLTSICSKSYTTICKECTFKNNNRIYVKEGINDLKTNSTKLASEWNFEKNNPLCPENVTRSSEKIVWWKCEKGHEWQQSVLNRTKHENSACPYCSNRKVLIGYNDFATMNPNLLLEWDYEKNSNINPSTILNGTNKKVWWICDKKHSYEASISNRVKGTGCPYCVGQKVLKGYNDLATTNPELLSEWDYEKNKISPDCISSGSGKSVWWICKKGHSWKSIISNRTKNGKRGCPYCANRILLKGFNDLKTTHPNLVNEWNYDRNKISPDSIISGSTLKVWWICDKGHEWKASIVSRRRNHFCPICNSNKQTSICEKAIVYYLEKKKIKLIENYKIGRKEIDIYIPSLKLGIEYDGQYYHRDLVKDLNKNELCKKNGIKLIRIREPELPLLNDYSIDIRITELSNDHSYMNNAIMELFRILNIPIDEVDVEKDFNEIYSLFQKGEKRDSIAVSNHELLIEWDYEKNINLKPEQVSKGSHNDVWWKCSKCNFSWKSKVYTRTLGSGCPKCSGRLKVRKPTKIEIGINDFATEHPELLKEWDYEKNKVKPNKLKSGSNHKVWWICNLNHNYEASISNRLKGTACPYCANKKVLKGYNDLATTNPELLLEWDYNKNIDVTPESITNGSGKRIWWICPNKHSYSSICYSRKNGSNCPYCSGRKVLKGYNDLATTNPELLSLWDYEKNATIIPSEVSAGSHIKVWWKCSKCNHEWQNKIESMKLKKKCPICKKDDKKH